MTRAAVVQSAAVGFDRRGSLVKAAALLEESAVQRLIFSSGIPFAA